MNDAAGNIISALPALIIVLIALAFLWLYIWSFVWLYKDAQLREKSGCLVVLILFFLVPWPWGLLIWLICRPNLRYYYYSEPNSGKPIADVIEMKKCQKCNMPNALHNSRCLYCGAEFMEEGL